MRCITSDGEFPSLASIQDLTAAFNAARSDSDQEKLSQLMGRAELIDRQLEGDGQPKFSLLSPVLLRAIDDAFAGTIGDLEAQAIGTTEDGYRTQLTLYVTAVLEAMDTHIGGDPLLPKAKAKFRWLMFQRGDLDPVFPLMTEKAMAAFCAAFSLVPGAIDEVRGRRPVPGGPNRFFLKNSPPSLPRL